jgi:hypothetical protein
MILGLTVWDWPEGATSRATGVALTQPEAASAPVRAALRCNRIQLDAMRNRANQPGFSFWRPLLLFTPAGTGERTRTQLTLALSVRYCKTALNPIDPHLQKRTRSLSRMACLCVLEPQERETMPGQPWKVIRTIGCA